MKTTRFLFTMFLLSSLILAGCAITDEAPEAVDVQPVVIDEVIIDEVEPIEADEEIIEDADVIEVEEAVEVEIINEENEEIIN